MKLHFAGNVGLADGGVTHKQETWRGLPQRARAFVVVVMGMAVGFFRHRLATVDDGDGQLAPTKLAFTHDYALGP